MVSQIVVSFFNYVLNSLIGGQNGQVNSQTAVTFHKPLNNFSLGCRCTEWSSE